MGHVNSGPDQNSAAYEQGRHCLHARIQKVGSNFDNVFLFFLVDEGSDEGREDPNTTISMPLSAR